MIILALDPGNTKTAWVLYDGGTPVTWGYHANEVVRRMLARYRATTLPILAVEYMRPRGMLMSQEAMDTMFELGRMVEAWRREWKPVGRLQAKLHICGSPKANDANIRAALIDRYGGPRAIAPARKCPTCKGRGAVGRGKVRLKCGDCGGTGKGAPAGMLHGMAGDVWAALAIAITAEEKP